MSMAPEELQALADEFAFQLCYSPHDALSAGLRAFHGDSALAQWAAGYWRMHPYITAKVGYYMEEYGAEYFLPTKEEIIHKAISAGDKSPHMEDKLKGYRLAAELLGYISKDGKGVTVNVKNAGGQQTNKVMMIKDHGDNWEKAATAQQRTLTGS